MRNRTSDLRIPHSDALPLSHRDSSVSKVYYEVHMTRVLHTARISNVNSVMFLGLRIFFFVSYSLQDEKHLSLFLYQAQNLPSLSFLSTILSLFADALSWVEIF